MTDINIAIPFVSNLPRDLKEDVQPVFAARVNGAPLRIKGETQPFENSLRTHVALDLDAFPCLRLAREAAQAGGTAPCVLNAANEVAVHAFLHERLPFNAIPAAIERTLERLPSAPVRAFESLYEAAREARAVAGEAVAALA